MIMINLTAFPGTRDDAEEHVRSLLAGLTAHGGGHNHEYAILLAALEEGHAYELNRIEAPCARTDQKANLTAIINLLHETADELAAAHADILYPAPAAADEPDHNPTSAAGDSEPEPTSARDNDGRTD